MKAIKGETLPKVVDTGYYWYDKTNITESQDRRGALPVQSEVHEGAPVCTNRRPFLCFSRKKSSPFRGSLQCPRRIRNCQRAVSSAGS